MIETARLRLRRLRPADEAALIALDSDPAVMRFVGSPPGVRTHDETVKRVRQRMEADHGSKGGWWVVEDRDATFHGVGLLLPMPVGGDVEVGYRLTRRSWGRGIATETGSALVDHAFSRLALPRVVAVVYPENLPSRRVLAKLGFAADGLREYKGASVLHFVLDGEAWRNRRRVDKRDDAPP